MMGKVSDAKGDHLYRCSGCGKLVDDRNAEEVELHRHHVFNPNAPGTPRQHQTTEPSPT